MLIAAIRNLIGFLAPYPMVLPGVAVLGAIASLAEGLGIGLLIPFLSRITATNAGQSGIMDAQGESGIASGGGMVARSLDAYATLWPDNYQLIIVATTIALLVVLSCIVSYLYLRLLAWAATRVTHDLRTRLFERFVNSDQLFLEQGSQGRQVKAIDGSAYRAGQAIISLCMLLAKACTVLVIVTLLALISWRMTLVVLVAVAMAGLVVRLFIARSMSISGRFEKSQSQLSDTTISALSSLRMVRIFGQEAHESKRFDRVSHAVRTDQFTLETVRRSMEPLVDGIAVPLLIAGLVVATYNDVSAMILLPFLLLVFRVQRYAREFDENRVRIAADAGAIFEVSEMLSADMPMARRGGVEYAGLQNELVFREVSFVHSGESGNKPSLARIDLTIRRGETLGIVGGSGAGKSTLINLLCGFYTPTEGDIIIDGISLSTLDLAQWRSRLGFAGQDADLRPGSIFENIAYGEPDASIERVEEAARQASAHTFISALSQGYQTPVGVRGMQLSGGERQRIALARALLRRPEILILDEATNAVDNLTEALIHEAITTLAGSTTLIVIAHRLSSIRDADRVIVMSQGEIVESGCPDELLARKGAFSELSLADGRLTA